MGNQIIVDLDDRNIRIGTHDDNLIRILLQVHQSNQHIREFQYDKFEFE